MFAESFPRVLVGGIYPVPHGLVTGTFVICGQAAQSFSGDFLAESCAAAQGPLEFDLDSVRGATAELESPGYRMVITDKRSRNLTTLVHRMKVHLVFLAAVLLCPGTMHAEEIPLTDPRRIELRSTRAETTTYRGRQALQLTEKPAGVGQLLAILRSHPFHDGTIDIDVAGALSKTAAESDRGFIGIAFRMQADELHYECIYIRPTNGRAHDQLRRNHSTEYESMPDWPWHRLRKESPGVYESYADMEEGKWIHMKIVVQGTKAALYLGNAAKPCLLINDLKLGDVQGAIALWGGSGTDGYFANLEISNNK